MTPADLSLTVLHAVRRAVDDGALRVDVPESLKIERPRPGGRGDYASNVALVLARGAQRAPRDVAAILRDRLDRSPGIAAVDITGPGFLNFTLRREAQQDLVREILRLGPRYGWREPTGESVRIGHRADIRAAVTADAVRRILLSQGIAVRTGGPAPEFSPLPVPHTSRDLLHRLGVDAARWGLLSAAAHDQARLGSELLRQDEGNPLFRVRYAYSRTRALVRNAEQLGFRSETSETRETKSETKGETSEAGEHVGAPALTHVNAPALTHLLGDHPVVLASAARHRAPDRVARHLEAIADALLDFQHTVLPRGDEKPSAAHRSRLALAEAAGVVLAGGLSLLGISAPDQI
ncbi:ArgS-related anticodon-binding protein NrtL [Streptomyces sp. NPDC059875]|uniref:ArgS-related anticodon-binding protein NrtL n=1 Tax=unclassified Streptomyces TaxID=2593676 RepID=UPI003648AFB1